jgi:hypothetical protein
MQNLTLDQPRNSLLETINEYESIANRKDVIK